MLIFLSEYIWHAGYAHFLWLNVYLFFLNISSSTEIILVNSLLFRGQLAYFAVLLVSLLQACVDHNLKTF